ncbi:MAG: single-stranded-DNA-specific exonuclease RecJ [Desulfosarcina sp.]
MQKQWQLLDPDPETVRSLARQLGCGDLIARLLAIRDVQSKVLADRFLSPSLADLTPPLELAGMDTAVRRIYRALVSEEKILVFGDYDADGITATALLVDFLRHCGARVVYAIPHRMRHGYGMDVDFVTQRALPTGIGLIVTVDCGSSSPEAITRARQADIHTIVTDHHPVARMPEDAVAVINPTRTDCPANLAHLAGVGVSFYLTIALRAHLRRSGFWQNRREPNLKHLCDLVALGTVADMVPLIRENRTLTIAGLHQINRRLRPGIAELMRMSMPPEMPADAETIAFRLAPRINAAGRLVHARMACELLLTSDRFKAARLARALCRINSRRQAMETDLFESIQRHLTRTPDLLARPALVLDGQGWHEGILGIVAARLTRQYHRPAVVISSRNGLAKGSGRSIGGIDLVAALEQCRDLLDHCGGHPLAAGLSLNSRHVSAFRNRLETIVAKMGADRRLDPQLAIDAHLPLDRVTPELMERLDRLAPFGQGNPYPLFMASDVRIHSCRRVGDRHRQMVLESESGQGGKHPAIQFNAPDEPAVASNRFEKIAYRPQWNFWKGKKRLQLMIEDCDPTS